MKKLLASISVMAIAIATVASSDAEARRRGPGGPGGIGPRVERLVIPMHNLHLRGRNVIRIKQELRRAYPGINLNRMRLESVRLVAKSKQGRGSVSLEIGGMSEDRAQIDGRPGLFHRNGPRTFDRIDLTTFGRTRGSWQLALRGNIKVKRLVVFAKEERRRHRRRGPGRRF